MSPAGELKVEQRPGHHVCFEVPMITTAVTGKLGGNFRAHPLVSMRV
jgi:hypothetical protein